MPGAEKVPSFQLTNASQGFASRTSDIFSGLDSLTPQNHSRSTGESDLLKEDPRDEPISSSDRKRFQDCPTRYNRSRDRSYSDHRSWRDRSREERSPGGSTSYDGERQRSSQGFQPPVRRPPRSRKVPDYKRHPERWTCYDLSDVSKDQLSERSNTAAAYDFLNERRKQREAVAAAGSSSRDMEMDIDDQKHKHTFVKKPKETLHDSDIAKGAAEVAPKFTAGKRVMPEYVIGGEQMPKRKPKSGVVPTSTMSNPDAVQLAHLDDESLEENKKIPSVDSVLKVSDEAGQDKVKNSTDTGSEETVTFKSRKGKKRGTIRSRHDEDDEDN